MLLRSQKTAKPQLDINPETRETTTEMGKDAPIRESETPGDTQTEDAKNRFAIRKIAFSRPRSDPKQKEGNKPEEPPPIIVPHSKQHQEDNGSVSTDKPDSLKRLLKSKLVCGEFLIKNLKTVTQIRATSTIAHGKIKQLLEKNKYEFYSYSNDGPKFRKFVLYGLNKEDIGEITADLKEYGFEPADIKAMTIKRPRYHDHTNYLIYFDYDTKITMEMIAQAKYICNTHVTWAHYRSPPSKCMQCRTCYRFGHIATECKMQQTCFLCSENHEAEKCPLMLEKTRAGTDKIPESHLKCCNCGLEHTAVYQHCPSRLNYINKRNKPMTTRTSFRAEPKFINAPLPFTNAWTNTARTPSQPNRIAAGKQRLVSKSNSPPRRPLQLRVVPEQTPRSRDGSGPAGRPIYHNKQYKVNRQTNQQADNNTKFYESSNNRNGCGLNNATNNSFLQNKTSDTFAPQELTEIFGEMLRSVCQCRTKQEQLQAMMNIAFKYTPCLG